MITRWPVHEFDEIEAVANVLRSGKTNYWTGEQGQAFEREFAVCMGMQHKALAVSNGTTALECALHAVAGKMGYDPLRWAYEGSGSAEVIVPCRTFMATASACVMNGYRPVLADIDQTTLNVSVETLEARRTKNTHAVILVHFGGRPVDLDVYRWAADHKLMVIDDCAHAHGAVHGPAFHHNMRAGVFADIACFSFCVGKIMSLGGEGGMCVTPDEDLYRRMAAYRDHGRYQMVGSKDMTQFQWTVEEFGSNLRMTEMQAAIGRVQLQKLPRWIERRREIANRYNDAFGCAVSMHRGHSYYLYIMLVVDRDRILAELNERGIPARIGGCPNIGREAAFARIGVHACPNADKVGEHTLALPIYPTMTDDEVTEVIEGVTSCLRTSR